MVRLVGKATDAIIPRERIRNIRIVHDTSARYPFAQFFLGFILVLWGGIGVLVLILTPAGGASPIRLEDGELQLQLVPVALWLAVALGLWSLRSVFRPSYHLTIETDERVRRRSLGSSRDVDEIRQLVRRATWSFGYEIEASVLGEAHPAPDRAVGAR